MNATCRIVILATLGLSLALAQQTLRGTVSRVIDGDTVVLRVGGEEIQVRLYGLDAPERRQPWGRESRNALRDLVGSRRVRVIVMATELNSRSVGRVFIASRLFVADTLDVNTMMVRAGHAWWDKRHVKADTALESAERHARSARLGLWSKPHVPPWNWRRTRRR